MATIERVVWASRVGTTSANTGRAHLVDWDGPENERWDEPRFRESGPRRGMMTLCGRIVGRYTFTPTQADQPCVVCSRRAEQRESAERSI